MILVARDGGGGGGVEDGAEKTMKWMTGNCYMENYNKRRIEGRKKVKQRQDRSIVPVLLKARGGWPVAPFSAWFQGRRPVGQNHTKQNGARKRK